MRYNPDIHQRRSIRLKGYNYALSGAYFVTICTHARECLFAEFADERMILNDAGKVVQKIWDAIPVNYPGIETDLFVIMPNHIHGIIVIREPEKQGAMNCAPTLGMVVRGYKARCTHAINAMRKTVGTPVWQRNYYERILRYDRELSSAREYIFNNPAQWDTDKNNPST